MRAHSFGIVLTTAPSQTEKPDEKLVTIKVWSPEGKLLVQFGTALSLSLPFSHSCFLAADVKGSDTVMAVKLRITDVLCTAAVSYLARVLPLTLHSLCITRRYAERSAPDRVWLGAERQRRAQLAGWLQGWNHRRQAVPHGLPSAHVLVLQS